MNKTKQSVPNSWMAFLLITRDNQNCYRGYSICRLIQKKPSDRNQYLSPSSCHPKTTTKAIPFSLSLRIVRICSKPEDRDKRLAELKELLLARNYPETLIDRSIEKARKIPRKFALLKVQKKSSETGPVFILQYDPRLPSIQQIVAKHWRSMKSQDKYLSDCFSKPMLTAYRRQPNLRNILIKSRIPPPPNPYPKRDLKGMKKCGLVCTACPYIIDGKSVKIDGRNSWKIEKMSLANHSISSTY